MISLTATQLKKHKVLRAEKAHSQHRLYPVSFPKRQTSPNFHEFRQCFVLVWFPFIYWFLDWIPKAQVTKVKIEKWNSIEEAAAHQGIEENSHKPFIWQGMDIETILKIQKDLIIKTLQIGQGTKNNHFKRHANGQVHENKSGVSLIIREMWLRITPPSGEKSCSQTTKIINAAEDTKCKFPRLFRALLSRGLLESQTRC